MPKTKRKVLAPRAPRRAPRRTPQLALVAAAAESIPQQYERVQRRSEAAHEDFRAGRYGRAFRRAVAAPFEEQAAIWSVATKHLARGNRRARRNGALPWANGLLSAMLALRTAYQYLHWNAKDYANHLLFERLYLGLDEDIDTLAELTVKTQGSVAPVPAKVSPRDVEAAENTIIAVASTALKQGVDYDFDNYLMALVEHRRRALYLLRQRSRG